MTTSRGQYLTELRRSNAAGIHNARPTRSASNQAAIKEELEMSLDLDAHLEADYEDRISTLDQIPEPTDDDIWNEEEYVPGEDEYDWPEDDSGYPYVGEYDWPV